MDDVQDMKCLPELESLGAELQRLLGDRFRMLAMYGSALRSDFDPLASDINLLLALDKVDLGSLARLADPLQLARGAFKAATLVMGERELALGFEVFPIKFHELRRNYRVIAGEDVLRPMPRKVVSPLAADEISASLQWACRQELCNTTLKLRRAMGFQGRIWKPPCACAIWAACRMPSCPGRTWRRRWMVFRGSLKRCWKALKPERGRPSAMRDDLFQCAFNVEHTSPGDQCRSGSQMAPRALCEPVALRALPKAKHFLDRTLVLEPFVFQWHLDDACNLQCRHCYREAPRSAMTKLERRALLAEMVEFLKALGRRGRIHFAGGEPFACEDFLPMARLCSEEGLAFRILSNGTLITEDAARELVELHCLGIQVSIEGPQEIHDEIRGCGSFVRAMEGVRVAREAGLQVTLAMTLHQGNLAHLETVGELAAQHADRAYFSRMVPLGCGKNLGELTALQWEKAMERVLRVQSAGKVPVALRDPTFKPRLVSPWRAWRYKGHGGCDAGRSTLCIESDGTVMPCRRLGISLGRVQDSSLVQIWNTHPLLESLRTRRDLKGACGRCAYRKVCGGCRAFSMALSGELKGQDPMCPWAAPQKRARVFMRHLGSCLFSA